MTILFTLVGIIVFFISLITTKFDFKTSFFRLMYFTIAGLAIDVILITASLANMYGYMY